MVGLASNRNIQSTLKTIETHLVIYSTTKCYIGGGLMLRFGVGIFYDLENLVGRKREY